MILSFSCFYILSNLLDNHAYCNYNKIMKYEWDENKAAANMEHHGIDFQDIIWFEWDSVKVEEDSRKDYGEKRFIAYGQLMGRLMVLVFTMRGETVRIISLRKANKREDKHHGN